MELAARSGSVCTCRNDKFVMAHQQHQLSMLQRLLPSAKKVPGGVKGRVSMTLQDGASTSDILTGILQASTVAPLCLCNVCPALLSQQCTEGTVLLVMQSPLHCG